MKKLISKIQDKISRSKIQKQLNYIYIIAMLIPIICIGGYLVISTSRLLLNYHKDLIESDNLRVKTIVFEMTSQIYNISEDISFDDSLQKNLSIPFKSPKDFILQVENSTVTENYLYSYAEIDDIRIYLDLPQVADYKQFYKATDEIQRTEWYQKAIAQFSVFWYPLREEDKYGNEYWKLALVRKIPLMNGEGNAVLVITISDNYLKSRIDNNQYLTLISIDDNTIFYGTNRLYYGEKQPIAIDYQEKFYHYAGSINFQNKKYMTNVSTLNLYQSDSKIYICSLNAEAYTNTSNIIITCLLIILVAAILPAIVIRLFTHYFTGRVNSLREEMHKASKEEYDIVDTIQGDDELSEALGDLKIMVQKIKKKDSEMYESRIKEQKLKNEQQVMEFKMLASQINPHFLYNTLETIRMKALTGGNSEVANAIKLLGKSMRYVLENTGTSSTTLKNELTYIETYLMIQKIRFNDKVNYELNIEEGMNVEDYQILPLLLQPIVENAILHGLEEVESNGKIMISVSAKNDEILLINIQDNGCGMGDKELEVLMTKIRTPNLKFRSSIGLYNINQRIRLCYGENYGMEISSCVGVGTQVSLVLPLKDIGVENN